MKVLIICSLFLLATTSFATDPCLGKGGKIVNGSHEKGLVRVCAFEESGIGSAIGYNDIFLKSLN